MPSTTTFARVAALLSGIALSLPAVVHAQAKPALTRDVDRPGAQPVNGFCAAFSNNTTTYAKCPLFTVPAGKRLVVETFGYRTATATGSVVYLVTVGEDSIYVNPYSAPNVYTITPVLAYDTGSARVYSATQSLKFYLDEGLVLSAFVSRGGTANYQQAFNFSGYLVDK